jgi:hypothetical protein
LEEQTDVIVQSIQNLLNMMRQAGPYGQPFLSSIQGIVDVVQKVSHEANLTLSASDLYATASNLLSDMSAACSQIESLGRDMVNIAPNKALKQKMASSAYEIAKYIKELLNLLE